VTPVTIGLPGGAHQRVDYTQGADVPTIMGNLANRLAAPPWLSAWFQPHLLALVTGPASYVFDTADDVVDWIVLRELAASWRRFAANPAVPAGVESRGQQLKTKYALVEQIRTQYAAAGALGGNFYLFGLTYQLQNAAANHFYASRNGHVVVYGGFTRADARRVLDHLEHKGANTAYPGEGLHVDNFVCAFLAEPTRWPEEQVFNLLAVTRPDGPGNTQMVGGGVAGTLPMAGGSTWEPALGAIGPQLPKRALDHARSEGIKDLIDDRLGNSPDFQALVGRVARRLQLIN